MNRIDSLMIRQFDRTTGIVTENVVDGVWCVETDAIQVQNNGFVKNGQIIVRIPEQISVSVACGDEICCRGSQHWFTVTEIQNNQKSQTGLNHLKIIGKR